MLSTLQTNPLAIALPTCVIQCIRTFQQDGLTGQIVLNYNHGEIQSYQSIRHVRVRKD